MNNSEQSYAIIAFGEVEGPNTKISADQVFEGLFPKHLWYVTRTSLLTPGMTILFYQSGKGFRATATLKELANVETNVLLGNRVFLTFTKRLALENCKAFTAPIDVRDFVGKLDFISDKKYWGHAFRSTPRRISESDYNTIMKHAPRRSK